MTSNCQDTDHSCCTPSANAAVQQSLDEMDFERGIWHAAQQNDAERVESLRKKGISVDAVDSAGYTALHYASRNGHHAVCKLLLENGAMVNAVTRCARATALHRAASQGHANIVQLLLKYDANPNLQDDDGYTALHRAIVARSTPVLEMLLPVTDLTLTDNHARTPKSLAKEVYPDSLTLFEKNSVAAT